MTLYNRFAALSLAVGLATAGTLAAVAVSGDDGVTPERAQAFALAQSATPIGGQSGCIAAANRLRRLDPAGTNATGTGAWDKLERTCLILATDHDAAITTTPPPPPTTTSPPPTTTAPAPKRLAPQAYNAGSRGQDPRYCIHWPGVVNVGPNRWRDEGGFEYDDGGLSLGGRTVRTIAGLKPADEMDSREVCDPDGAGHPPYPAESFLP